MILECTQCRTRYLVPDTSIGIDGRTVRCANCKHSWFQQAAVMSLDAASAPLDPVVVPEPARQPPAAEPAVAQLAPHRPAARSAPPPTAERPTYSYADPGADTEEIDAFAHQPPFQPRRHPTRRWTAAAFVAGISMVLGIGAIVYTGAPGIAAQLGLPIGNAATPLLFAADPIERRYLASGNELFVVSGRVTNPSKAAQQVPDILVKLQDAQDRVVYSWTITPERRTLAPKATLKFSSGKLDVPANSKVLDLSFAGEAAR